MPTFFGRSGAPSDASPAAPALTARQRQILDWIRSHLESVGRPPTRAEIATGLGFSTPSSAEDHLRALEKKAVPKSEPAASRACRSKIWPAFQSQGPFRSVGRFA